MFRKPYIRNILSAIAILIFGFILLNLTFLFNFLVFSLINRLFPFNPNNVSIVFPLFRHLLFLIIILIISWLVFKSRLGDIYKAIFSTVPLAVIFVTMGMFLYKWPILLYSVCVLIFAAIIFYLYRTKKSWLYYYSTILVSMALLIMGILGVEI